MRKKMLCLGVLGLTLNVLAQPDEAKFEEAKSRMLKHLDEKLTKLQETKNCVNNAKDHDALRACKPRGDHGDKGPMGRGKRPPKPVSE